MKNKKYEYYNYYNLDNKESIYFSNKYYLQNPDDINKQQKLNIFFTDIELYQFNKESFEFHIANEPVNAITTFSTKSNKYVCFFPSKGFDNNWIDFYKKELKENKYIKDIEELEIVLCKTEYDLLYNYWEYLIEENPTILSGYNSHGFDYGYLYKRTKHKDVKIKISDYFIKSRDNDNILDIVEFPILDIQQLFMPREDGGLNYGKKLPTYKLDFVSETVLNLKKLEYGSTYLDLNEFYLKDKKHFYLYNIIDVCLCVRLNEKLNHIELHNLIRRNMFCSFKDSTVGNSALFESKISYELLKDNIVRRYKINEENIKKISKAVEDAEYYSKNLKQPFTEITYKDYRSLVYFVSGAFVKEPKEKIINDGSLIMDLDAQSMYPSMMIQHNISFDTLFGVIIDPYHNKFIEVLNEIILETNENVKYKKKIELFNNMNYMIENYKKEEDFKLEDSVKLFHIATNLLSRLINSQINLETIFNPKGYLHSLLLKSYFLDLINVLNRINPKKDIYNLFVYRYLFDQIKLKNINYIYIVENVFNSNTKIIKLEIEKAIEYLSSYSVTINGCLFYKHSTKLGKMVEFLEDFGNKRKEYRKIGDRFPEGSSDYNYYDNRQNAIKKVSNSSYGVSGLSTFKYSNSLIANSITASGRLTSKLAQYITEKILK